MKMTLTLGLRASKDHAAHEIEKIFTIKLTPRSSDWWGEYFNYRSEEFELSLHGRIVDGELYSELLELTDCVFQIYFEDDLEGEILKNVNALGRSMNYKIIGLR